jgi:hypothetical protein
MNRTLYALAFLSYNWETNHKDIIDSYIPLCCNICYEKGHKKLTREELRQDLLQTYGIRIPLGAVESILKRMAKEEFLRRDAGEYYVLDAKVHSTAKTSSKIELTLGFETLVSEIIAFSADNFDTSFNKNEIEDGLINFFKDNDLDILFANNEPNGTSRGVLPDVKESKKAKYIIAKYITQLQADNPERFNLVVKLAMGYFIASLITYKDLQNFSGNLKGVEIFLDAPIIFSLIGLNGTSNLNLTKELVDSLLSNGAKLKIFRVNYSEVINSIQDAISRLTTKKYDLSKSSRVLRTALREGLTSQSLQLRLNQLDGMLNNNSVVLVDSPTLSSNEKIYQIDESKLGALITDLYTVNGDSTVPYYKANTIERDVESISNIFKIRKHLFATSLRSCKAIFLTNNERIAYAAKRFEKDEWKYQSLIPVCVTDIFLSTILWANYPTKNNDLKVKQLMSECYNITELDNRILVKFYGDVKKMHSENKINDEQFYLLSANNIIYTVLEQKTYNDIEEYTDQTPAEILEDIQIKFNEELQLERDKLYNIDNNLARIAKSTAKYTFVFFGILFALTYLWLKSLNPKWNNSWLNSAAYGALSLFTVFGILRWMEFIPTKNRIETSIEEKIFSILKRILNK